MGAIEKGLVIYNLLFTYARVNSLRNAYCLAQFVLVLFPWKPSASIMRFIILFFFSLESILMVAAVLRLAITNKQNFWFRYLAQRSKSS